MDVGNFPILTIITFLPLVGAWYRLQDALH